MRQRPKSTIPSYSSAGLLRNAPHPVRDHSKFPPQKIADTGVDPQITFIEFSSKDIVKPLTRPSLYETPQQLQAENFKNSRPPRNMRAASAHWSLGTTKRPANIEVIPKFQQFTNYNSPPQNNYNDFSKTVYPKYSNTDHISIRNSNLKKVSDNKSFLKMKNAYTVQTESGSSWTPFKADRTVNNVSSANYNIITFQPITQIPQKRRMMDSNLMHKKKGVGEYADLTATYRTNYNKNYWNCYNENNRRFYKYTGIFSNMYDACHRNGNLRLPFQKMEKIQ